MSAPCEDPPSVETGPVTESATEPVATELVATEPVATERPPRPARTARTPLWLVFLGIVLVAFNLRPAVTSLGAVLDRVSAHLDLSPTMAGLLTTLPVLCFAGAGALAASLAQRLGVHTVLTGSMALVVVGSVTRAVTDATPVFFTATVAALAGMATGNVLLPACVKAYFPHRVGLLTAVYTTFLTIGTTSSAALTIPIGQAAGDWRIGLGGWGVTAAIAAVPWLLLALRGPRRAATGPSSRSSTSPARARLTFAAIARSRTAWALALFFGLQSTQAYIAFGWLPQIFKDAGIDATLAGILLSIMPLAAIPMSFALPAIAARLPDPRALVIACGLCYLAGYAGLVVAPAEGAYAWVLLIGLGGGSFPLALTLIAMRSREPETTARLSGFAQSVGYLLAAVGPLAIGALYGATDGWAVPIGFASVLIVPQVAAGVLASRPRYVDDEI
ncbi:MAG TPA: MFS transporter [Actinopolymorphaceae bacterium]